MTTAVLVALVTAVLAESSCLASATIWIKADSAWSVTGKDDLQRLKRLASGVGYEFEPNADTGAALMRIGIKTIRCINVDPLPGTFDTQGKFTAGELPFLNHHLDMCRAVGAKPHIIIATGIHPDLQVKEKDVKGKDESVMGMIHSTIFGPTDWVKFQNYCEAYFEHVLITKKFPDAEFEVANEPDIGGATYPFPPKPSMGSRALYEAYFNLYKNVAIAAESFEKKHPGMKIRLGGPAIAWAFTFKYGDFNWAERFLRDCSEQKIKLDFIGIHYYGNISSLDGEYPTNFPSFTQMLTVTKAARDKYCSGVPIWFTEWGPSYTVDNSIPSSVNANHVGAAWSAAFLNVMLQCGVDGALYLVTTDLRQQIDGKWENVWGWPSMFVNPTVFGKAYPKAPFHLFEMISKLEGHRIEASRGKETVNCFASADKDKKKITLLIWNYGAEIPEKGAWVEKAVEQKTRVCVRDAAHFFQSKKVKVERWLVSESASDAYQVVSKGGKLTDDNTALKQVGSSRVKITDGKLECDFALPPSSVSLVVLTAEK